MWAFSMISHKKIEVAACIVTGNEEENFGFLLI